MKINKLVPLPLILLIVSMLMLELASPVNAVTPQIVLSPDQGWYDTGVWVHGSGFAASAEVKITWEGLNFWQVCLKGCNLQFTLCILMLNVPALM